MSTEEKRRLKEIYELVRTHVNYYQNEPGIYGECGRLLNALRDALVALNSRPEPPIPMLLWCPECSNRHVDHGEFETKEHHTHACQVCGHVWRPAVVATVGVQFLPGFDDSLLRLKEGP